MSIIDETDYLLSPGPGCPGYSDDIREAFASLASRIHPERSDLPQICRLEKVSLDEGLLSMTDDAIDPTILHMDLGIQHLDPYRMEFLRFTRMHCRLVWSEEFNEMQDGDDLNDFVMRFVQVGRGSRYRVATCYELLYRGRRYRIGPEPTYLSEHIRKLDELSVALAWWQLLRREMDTLYKCVTQDDRLER